MPSKAILPGRFGRDGSDDGSLADSGIEEAEDAYCISPIEIDITHAIMSQVQQQQPATGNRVCSLAATSRTPSPGSQIGVDARSLGHHLLRVWGGRRGSEAPPVRLAGHKAPALHHASGQAAEPQEAQLEPPLLRRIFSGAQVARLFARLVLLVEASVRRPMAYSFARR